jgi:phosphoglycolate phosphatase-like HAD superfamily hydrolase
VHPAIFFDLDGTLTDPKPGITACIRYALQHLGRPLAADGLERTPSELQARLLGY